jgi:hypothetical protein
MGRGISFGNLISRATTAIERRCPCLLFSASMSLLKSCFCHCWALCLLHDQQIFSSVMIDFLNALSILGIDQRIHNSKESSAPWQDFSLMSELWPGLDAPLG